MKKIFCSLTVLAKAMALIAASLPQHDGRFHGDIEEPGGICDTRPDVHIRWYAGGANKCRAGCHEQVERGRCRRCPQQTHLSLGWLADDRRRRAAGAVLCAISCWKVSCLLGLLGQFPRKNRAGARCLLEQTLEDAELARRAACYVAAAFAIAPVTARV